MKHEDIIEKIDIQIGRVFTNKHGQKMKIIERLKDKKFLIEFDNGEKMSVYYANLTKGNVKGRYTKSIYNIGYLGEGKYTVINNDGKTTREYDTWHGMLRRCYSLNSAKQYPSYINCAVDEEWHNFQKFAEWYNKNYYEVDNERMHLDKDILIKGNKIYSAENCVFVPMNINALFLQNKGKRGNYLIGVNLPKKGRFAATYKNQITNKKECIGRYDKEQDAFNAYKRRKEEHIKEVAEYYKNKIPKKLYEAMLRFEVDIND